MCTEILALHALCSFAAWRVESLAPAARLRLQWRVPAPRKPPPRPRMPGSITDVTRMEHQNVEAGVAANARRLDRVEAKLDALAKELAELTKLVKALR
jgi:hypothetical protein